MPLYALDGVAPELPPDGDCYIADTAILIGRVRLAKGANIWHGAVLRGDNEPIDIGEDTNIQENCVLHTDAGLPLVVGRGCTIGHAAILHGCVIGHTALIGMSAVVLNGAVIGEECVVGAHALVGENKRFEARQLIVGVPAKAIRAIDEGTVEKLRGSASGYAEKARQFKTALVRVG
jgi:carbonic anhydrase/acetyltransferase-like protein (isoleucine patch superfamily)